jgi:hypothetical protein
MRLQVLIWVVFLAVAGLLLTSCGQVSYDYDDQVWEARQALVDGEVSYDPIERLLVGETGFFTAYVSGVKRSDSAKDKHKRYNDVPVNADIGVTLTCSGNVTCKRTGSARKVVLAGDSRVWGWSIRPTGSGNITLAVTVTAYLDDTNTVVDEVPLPPLHMEAEQTLTESLKSLFNVWVLGTMCGLLVVFATVWPVYRDMADRRAARRRQRAAEQNSADQTDHDGGNAPATSPDRPGATPEAERTAGS